MTLLLPPATAHNSMPDFSKRTCTIVLITPVLAAAWLELNENNRKLNTNTVNRLSTDLRDGNFLFTGEGIKFSTEGLLLDGQHRLVAIVRTGIAAEIIVVTGVQTAAQDVMDSGAVRSLAGALQIRSVGNAMNIAAALIAVQSWEHGLRSHDGSKGSTTISTSLRFLAEHPEVHEIAREALLLSAKIPGLTCKQIALFIWVFDQLDVDDRRDFFEKLRTGAGLEEGNPILALRDFLTADAMAAARVGSLHRMAVTVKAWNAYRDGLPVKKLTFKPGGANPETFPEPR